MALIPEYAGENEACWEPSNANLEAPAIVCNPPTSPMSRETEGNGTSNVPENIIFAPSLACIDDPSLRWPTEPNQETERSTPSPASFPLPSIQNHYVSENSETYSPFCAGRPEQGRPTVGMSTPVFSPQDVPVLTHSPSPDSPSGRSPSTRSRKTSPGHVKRPCNAFILFRSHAVTTNLVPKEIERDHRNISRIISHMWHSLDDNERKLWERQAEIEKQRHRELHPDYKYRPSSRRNNVLRRTARRLSSTERQCERIADAILKSCGREGVKRSRPGRQPTQKHFADHPSCSPCAIPEHRDTKISSPNGSPFMTLSSSEPSQSCVSSPSPTHVTNSIIPDAKPRQALPIRRSSSAPPLSNGLDTFCGSPTPTWPAATGENLPWLLGSPLVCPLSPKSHRSQLPESSQTTTCPGPTTTHGHDLECQPNDVLIPTDELLTFPPPHFDEPFYLGPSALPVQTVPPGPGMLPAFMPPVSPRTQDASFDSLAWGNLLSQTQTQPSVQPVVSLTPSIPGGGLLDSSYPWIGGEGSLGLPQSKPFELRGEKCIQNDMPSFLELIHGSSTV